MFCDSNSELTKQAQNLGYSAQRHSMEQGDLATQEGRHSLFQKVIALQPKKIWISPTCGPWSSWSNLNAQKSLEGLDMIHRQRQALLYQLALGIVLLRHQFQAGRHLHWEQPRRSAMFASPLLQELFARTWEAHFDKCRVEDLRDPMSQLLFQKSMAVRTTSRSMFESLHGRFCRHNHEHQPLEGSTQIKGVSIRRLEYSEEYSRKFARLISKQMVKSFHEVPKGYYEEVPALAAAAKRKSVSPAAIPSQGNKRARMSQSRMHSKREPARLVRPDDLPEKRQRTDDESNQKGVSVEEIVQEIKPILPRVGKTIINHESILGALQKLFDDKIIIKVVACKGTERAIHHQRAYKLKRLLIEER